LASSIDSGGDPVVDDTDFRLNTNFTFNTVTENDIEQHVTALRGGSAPGLDGVSASILKENVQLISRPFAHLVNLSLTIGTFPNNFKMAKIIPWSEFPLA
jgi:hypothetical protein